ncbi:hypothetical protein ACI797_12360 [Geodermatophilus sp. SYSU D00691]
MRAGGRRRLGVLVLCSAALAGCAAADADVQPAAATRQAAGQTWFLDSGGVVPPVPDLSEPAEVGLSPVVPRPSVPEFVPPVVPHGVGIEDEPPPAVCGGYANPVRINPGATPGPGTATISWMADGRPEVTGYRVQAVSQDVVPGEQPDPVRRTVAQPAGCTPVTTTLTGLTRGGVYVFWLEEAVFDPLTGVTRLVQVGSSEAVAIP